MKKKNIFLCSSKARPLIVWSNPILEQAEKLSGFLDLNSEISFRQLRELKNPPIYSTGWFVAPTIETVAKKYFPKITNEEEKYYQVLKMVFDLFSKKDPQFKNSLRNEITKDRFLRSSRTSHLIQILREKQKGDFLVFPGRIETDTNIPLLSNEFELDLLLLMSIIITHEEKIADFKKIYRKKLTIYSLGNSRHLNEKNLFKEIPCFQLGFDQIELKIETLPDDLDKYFICPTGFVV